MAIDDATLVTIMRWLRPGALIAITEVASNIQCATGFQLEVEVLRRHGRVVGAVVAGLADLPAVAGSAVPVVVEAAPISMKLKSGTITRSCRYQVAEASSPSTVISGWVTRCSVMISGPASTSA